MSTLTHHVDIIEKWPTGPAVESNEAGLGLPPTTKRLIQSARSCMPSMTAREVRNLCTLAEQTCWTDWTIRNNTCFCFEHLFRAIIFIYQSLLIILIYYYSDLWISSIYLSFLNHLLVVWSNRWYFSNGIPRWQRGSPSPGPALDASKSPNDHNRILASKCPRLAGKLG